MVAGLDPSSRALGSISASEVSPLSFLHGIKMGLGLQPLHPCSHHRKEADWEERRVTQDEGQWLGFAPRWQSSL